MNILRNVAHVCKRGEKDRRGRGGGIVGRARERWDEKEVNSGEKSRISKQIANLALEPPSCHLVTLSERFYGHDLSLFARVFLVRPFGIRRNSVQFSRYVFRARVLPYTRHPLYAIFTDRQTYVI